jgi:hypothetical protein
MQKLGADIEVGHSTNPTPKPWNSSTTSNP